jgi:uncharacterized protein YciI
MKTGSTGIITAFLMGVIAAASVTAQQKPEYDMGTMQMVFLSQSAGYAGGTQAAQIRKEHRAYVDKLVTQGKLALAGETTGDGELKEIMVVKTESLGEAQQMAQSFPAVKAGVLKAEVLSWYAARNLVKPPQVPLASSSYVFGILVRGPKWTKEQTEETQKIQEGHMANINRLAEMGKLVLAGPFVDGGDRRGIFIFRVNSLSEAQAFTDTDPAVIAGRLKIVLYQWSVPKGMLP